MSGKLRDTLYPPPGVTLSPGPWRTRDDGTVIARDGSVVCMLGAPEEDLADQDAANGAAILALPDLIAALAKLNQMARTSGGTAGADPLLIRACADAEASLLKAGRTPNG